MARIELRVAPVLIATALVACARASQPEAWTQSTSTQDAGASLMTPQPVADAMVSPRTDAATTLPTPELDASSTPSFDATALPSDASLVTIDDAATQVDAATLVDATAAQAVDASPPHVGDAASMPIPDGCEARTLARSDPARVVSNYTSVVLYAGSIKGGQIVFHNADGWGSDAAGVTTLGAITYELLDTDPIQELYPNGTGSACVPELRALEQIQIVSEDAQLLDETWPVTLHVLSDAVIVMDYDAAVTTLSAPLREQLLSDRRTANLDRIQFSFKLKRDEPYSTWSAEPAVATLVNSREPSMRATLFDWKPSCAPPVGLDAQQCMTGPSTTTLDVSKQCVASALAANRAFHFSDTAYGKGTLTVDIGTLTPPLASGRPAFFEMHTLSGQHLEVSVELRRCQAINLLHPANSTRPVDAITCVEPGPTLQFCNSVPEPR